jgi:hypothetical protein
VSWLGFDCPKLLKDLIYNIEDEKYERPGLP